MHQPVDSVGDYDFLQTFKVQNIGEYVGAVFPYFVARLYDIG